MMLVMFDIRENVLMISWLDVMIFRIVFSLVRFGLLVFVFVILMIFVLIFF